MVVSNIITFFTKLWAAIITDALKLRQYKDQTTIYSRSYRCYVLLFYQKYIHSVRLFTSRSFTTICISYMLLISSIKITWAQLLLNMSFWKFLTNHWIHITTLCFWLISKSVIEKWKINMDLNRRFLLHYYYQPSPSRSYFIHLIIIHCATKYLFLIS